jgi:hypothetical protein
MRQALDPEAAGLPIPLSYAWDQMAQRYFTDPDTLRLRLSGETYIRTLEFMRMEAEASRVPRK